MQAKIKRTKEHACFMCRNYIWEWRKVGSCAFCKAKNDWFPVGWSLSDINECGKFK